MSKSTKGSSAPIVKAIKEIQALKATIRSLNEKGTFTDADHKKVDTAEKKMADMKTKAAKELLASHKPPKKKFGGDAAALEDVSDFMEELALETDNKAGNLELFKSITTCCAVDMPTLCETRGLLATAAADGSKGYLDTLLSLNPPVRFDTVEVLSTAFFNQQCRIPLTTMLLKHDKALGLHDAADELEPIWVEFFADIAAKKRAIPREDRTGRLALMEKMATHKIMKIDPCDEGADAQTVFARAAHEGDVELMKMMITKKIAPPINRVQSDNTTALIQAVFSNNTEAVQLVLNQPGIDVNHESNDGTALALAQVLNRTPEIIKALKTKGGEEGKEQPTLKRAPTFAVPKRKGPHPPTSGSQNNPRQLAEAAAEKSRMQALEKQKEAELKAVEPKHKRNTKIVMLDPIPEASSPAKKLSARQEAVMGEKDLVTRVFNHWVDLVGGKRMKRRKSMLQKVIMFGGTTTGKLRMFFREWIQFLMQRKMQKRMDQIRDTIAKRQEDRKARQSKAAKTMSPRARQRSESKFSLMASVELIRLTKQSIDSMNAMGSFTDEEVGKTEKATESIQEMKLSGAMALDLAKTDYEPANEDEEMILSDFFEDLITSSDIKKGNLELAKAFLKKVKLDYSTLMEERGLVAIAACDGSRGYLDALLGHKSAQCDSVEVLSSAFFNMECRIPLALICLKHESRLDMAGAADEMQDVWEEFFADICSNKRSKPKEDRTGRLQLIEKMAQHKVMTINHEAEGPDAQTVFSRSAYEGDVELMFLLMKLKVAPDYNKVQSDGTTALIQAVFSNKPDAVKLLLGQPGIDTSHQSSDGNALTIARMLKRDPEIVKAIESHGAGGAPLAAPKLKSHPVTPNKDADAAFKPHPPKGPPTKLPSVKTAMKSTGQVKPPEKGKATTVPVTTRQDKLGQALSSKAKVNLTKKLGGKK